MVSHGGSAADPKDGLQLRGMRTALRCLETFEVRASDVSRASAFVSLLHLSIIDDGARAQLTFIFGERDRLRIETELEEHRVQDYFLCTRSVYMIRDD